MAKSLRDRFNRAMGATHAVVFRASKGRIGKSMQNAPIFLLTTTGARSGQPRTSPLIYLADGGGYVVAASNAGQDHAPGWYHNLLQDPSATVEVAGEKIAVTASIVPPAEKAELWAKLDGLFKGYARYRGKTSRDIPLLRLTPHL